MGGLGPVCCCRTLGRLSWRSMALDAAMGGGRMTGWDRVG